MSEQGIIRAYDARVEQVLPGEKSVIARFGSNELDRYGTVITPAGIDIAQFNRAPVFLFEHGKSQQRGTLPIGRGWVKYRRSEDDLIGKCIFREDEFSQQLFSMYQDGSLTGWSIRALPKAQYCSPPTYDEVRARPELQNANMMYRACELAEVSSVAVAGNRDALTLMVSRGLLTEDEAERAMTSTTGSSGGFLVGPDASVKQRKTAVTMPRAVTEPKAQAPAPSLDTRGPGQPGVINGPVPRDGEHEYGPGEPTMPAPRRPGSFHSPRSSQSQEGGTPDAHGGSGIEPMDDTNAGLAPRQKQGLSPEMSPDTRCATRTIKKVGDSYQILSHTGKRLGEYSTKAAATKRLQQIEYFKHQGSRAIPAATSAGVVARVGSESELEWRVEHRREGWCVVNKFGEVKDTYDTEAKANERLKTAHEHVKGLLGGEPSMGQPRSLAIDADGGDWHIRDSAGRSLLRFDNAADAEAALKEMAGPVERWLEHHEVSMAKLDAQLRALEDGVIAELELNLLGRV